MPERPFFRSIGARDQLHCRTVIVPCPKCRAAVGIRCAAPSGRESTHPHRPRISAANAAQKGDVDG